MSAASVEKFLGASAATGGASGLLGLAVGVLDDRAIRAALRERLSAVAAHPERDTPEADEVRLALHAAAAQLLDPAVRRLVRGGSSEAQVRPTAASSETHVGAVRDALRLVLSRGRFDRMAVRRVARVAHARGVPVRALIEVLPQVTGRRARSEPTRSSATPFRDALERVPVARQTSKSSQLEVGPEDQAGVGIARAAVLLAGGFALLVIAVGGVWLSVSLGGGSSPTVQTQPGVVSGGAGAASVQSGGASVASAASPVSSRDTMEDAVVEPLVEDAGRPTAASGVPIERLIRDLRRAAAASALDRDVLVPLIAQLSEQWTRLDAGEVSAGNAVLVDVAYRAVEGDRGAFDWFFDAVTSGERRLDDGTLLDARGGEAAVWSAGMLSRLSAERDLPASARRRLAAAVARRLGADGVSGERTFRAGAGLGVREVAGVLARGGGGAAGAWEAWLRCVEALTEADSPERTAMVLLGIDALLREGEDPARSARTHGAIVALAAAPSWRADEGGRLWLLQRLGDPRVSSAQLHALTTGVAMRSSAEGVDATMVVRPGATGLDRRAMLDRYAAAWGIEDEAGESAWRSRWGRVARRAIDIPSVTPTGALRRAVVLSRLNESAVADWRRDVDGARSALDDAEGMLDRRDGSGRGYTRDVPVAGADAWWSRYLALGGNVPGRLDLLLRISGRAPESLSAQAGTVLIREAVRGTPERVRSSAREVIKRFVTSPAVVKAALDELPRTAPNAANRELLNWITGTLGPGDDVESWEHRVRRALVERLLELTASSGDLAETDELVEMLAVSYSARAGMAFSAEPRAAAAAVRVDRARRAATLVPTGRVPVSPGEIESRRVSRQLLARGPVQAFVVEQLAGVELLGYVIAVERPARAGRVRVVLEDLEAERQLAGHVFEQVVASERAAVRLWMLRLGEVAP